MAGDSLVECPVCGTFLEPDEAAEHADGHFAPPPENDPAEANGLAGAPNGRDAPGSDFNGRAVDQLLASLRRDVPPDMGALVCGNLAQYFDVSREHLCGYRNLQTLLSALLVHPGVEDRLLRILGSRGVPTVRQIQEAIEKAWAGGFDPAGRKHFDGKLVGTRKWIGATEAAVFLIHLGFRAKVVDFHKPTGPMRTHPRLVEFAFDYFARDAPLRPGVSKVDRLPLYFQHQGHSRTIAGVRWDGNGHGGADMDCSLLVLDPGKRGEVTAAEATVTGEQLSRNAQYQIVEVAALEFDSEAERVAGGREIRSVRIP